MNLAENYKRLFGQFDQQNKLGQRTVAQNHVGLSEQENKKWLKISEAASKQFPSDHIYLKEGYLVVNGLLVDKISEVLKNDTNAIMQNIKNYSGKNERIGK